MYLRLVLKNSFFSIVVALPLFLYGCELETEKSEFEVENVSRSDSKNLVTDPVLYSIKVDGGIYPDYKMWGYKKENGEKLTDPIFDAAQKFEKGLARVAVLRYDSEKDSLRENVSNRSLKWGFIDKFGKQVVGFQYDEIREDYKYSYKAVKNNRIYLLNDRGEIQRKLDHKNERAYNDSLLMVSGFKGSGLMDSSYNYIIEPKYSWFGKISDNSILVFKRDSDLRNKDSQRVGYFDTKGKEIIPLKFTNGGPFKNGKAMVTRENSGRIEVINKEGQTVYFLDELKERNKTKKEVHLPDTTKIDECLSTMRFKGLIDYFFKCTGSMFNEVIVENEIFYHPYGGEGYMKESFGFFESGFYEINSVTESGIIEANFNNIRLEELKNIADYLIEETIHEWKVVFSSADSIAFTTDGFTHYNAPLRLTKTETGSRLILNY